MKRLSNKTMVLLALSMFWNYCGYSLINVFNVPRSLLTVMDS